MTKKYWIASIAAITIAYILGFVEGCTYARHGQQQHKPDTATVTIYDTLPYTYPVPVDSTVIRYELIKIPGATVQPPTAPDSSSLAPDSSLIPDTSIVLPITQKKYQDSTYTAYVSGYHPQLDSIFIYQRHTYTTITQPTPAAGKKKHWGIGVQVGAGWNINSATHPDSGWNPWIPAPYIGVGISYNFITF